MFSSLPPYQISQLAVPKVHRKPTLIRQVPSMPETQRQRHISSGSGGGGGSAMIPHVHVSRGATKTWDDVSGLQVGLARELPEVVSKAPSVGREEVVVVVVEGVRSVDIRV